MHWDILNPLFVAIFICLDMQRKLFSTWICERQRQRVCKQDESVREKEEREVKPCQHLQYDSTALWLRSWRGEVEHQRISITVLLMLMALYKQLPLCHLRWIPCSDYKCFSFHIPQAKHL